MEIFSDLGKRTSLELILASGLVMGGGSTDSPTVTIQPIGKPVLANISKKPSEPVTTTPSKGKTDEPACQK